MVNHPSGRVLGQNFNQCVRHRRGRGCWFCRDERLFGGAHLRLQSLRRERGIDDRRASDCGALFCFRRSGDFEPPTQAQQKRRRPWPLRLAEYGRWLRRCDVHGEECRGRERRLLQRCGREPRHRQQERRRAIFRHAIRYLQSGPAARLAGRRPAGGQCTKRLSSRTQVKRRRLVQRDAGQRVEPLLYLPLGSDRRRGDPEFTSPDGRRQPDQNNCR